VSDKIILAKPVRGPFVRKDIFSPGFSFCAMDSHTSNAKGCLSSGTSVSLGAPYFTEFSAVYLEWETLIIFLSFQQKKHAKRLHMETLVIVQRQMKLKSTKGSRQFYLLGLLGKVRPTP
jgi:hypothetical protein